MTILVSPVSDRNVLLGIEVETGNAHAIPFQLVTNAVVQNKDGISVKSKLTILKKAFSEYIKAEKNLQKN